jgi:quercetin dioxygenase-like cupin family protein
VDYAPGAASGPQVYPDSVFAYVLEGRLVSQAEEDKPTTYESPKKPHVVSNSASKTEPAKLLVFLLSQEAESLVVPVKSPDSGR